MARQAQLGSRSLTKVMRGMALAPDGAPRSSIWVLTTGDTVMNRPSRCDARLHKLIASAEVAFANLEVPLTTRGAPAEKAATHRADPQQAQQLKDLGLSVVTLANNHALDYGWDGLQDTLQSLSAAGIAHVGAGDTVTAALTPHLHSSEFGTVALIGLCSALPPGFAATDDRPGVAPLRVLQQVAIDPALAAEQPGMAPFVHTTAYAPDLSAAAHTIRQVSQQADLVIVAIHWGVPHGFAAPSYGPLAEYQRPVAQALIDAGAHLVLGHHPHVVQPIERMGHGLVAYSIGNFMFHNWSQFSGSPDPSREASTDLFPLQTPSAPYRSAFSAEATLESVVVTVTPPTSEGVHVRFVPTLMRDGDPTIPNAARCHTILDRLEEGGWRSTATEKLNRRTDIIADAVVGEVALT